MSRYQATLADPVQARFVSRIIEARRRGATPGEVASEVRDFAAEEGVVLVAEE